MKKIILILLSISLSTTLFGFTFNLDKAMDVLGDIKSNISDNSQNKNLTDGIIKVGTTTIDANKNSQFTIFDEYNVGLVVTAKILGRYKILKNEKLTQYVNAVGHTLLLSSRMPNHYNGIKFVILDNKKEINAFSTPGGFVMITTGMLNFLENEDELAVILGHEIGHLEYEHGIAAIKEANNMQIINVITNITLSSTIKNNKLANRVAGELLEKIFENITGGYAVELESQADKRGMELAYEAGYSPDVFPMILKRFKEKTNSYGGANYPEEREEDAKKVLSSFKSIDKNRQNISLRTRRYKKYGI